MAGIMNFWETRSLLDANQIHSYTYSRMNCINNGYSVRMK